MMEAVSTSETSTYFYQTTRGNIAEDSRVRQEEQFNKQSVRILRKFNLRFCLTWNYKPLSVALDTSSQASNCVNRSSFILMINSERA
jgi:hypothetical protein